MVRIFVEYFNPPNVQINLISFIKFSLSVFRFVQFDIDPLPAEATFKEKFFYRLREVYIIFFLVCYILSIVSFIVSAITINNFIDGLPPVLDALALSLVAVKMWNTTLRKKEIKCFLAEMQLVFDHRLNQNKTYNLNEYLANYNRLAIILASSVIVLILKLSVPIIPFLLFGTMGLPSKYWFPFDPFTTRNYLFAFGWSNWIAWVGLPFFVACDTLIYALATIISMEFDFLKIDAMNLRDVPKEEKAKYLQDLIDTHNELLTLAKRLQDLYSITFLMSFVTSSIVMCLIAFILSLPSSNLDMYIYYVPYLVATVGQVFLPCVFGEKLIGASSSLVNGFYDCGWEEFDDEKFKKQIIPMISRAQKVKGLNAMGFAAVSFETFATVSCEV